MDPKVSIWMVGTKHLLVDVWVVRFLCSSIFGIFFFILCFLWGHVAHFSLLLLSINLR